jgi:hypothetical protein
VAGEGETEPMCRDILIKSARMGHRPNPRPIKAVSMNGVIPRSKVAGVPMGTGQRDLVLLEKDDAQEGGNGEKAPEERATEVEHGAAAMTGLIGQELGENRELQFVKGTAEKTEMTGQTGTQTGNCVVDKKTNLFVLAEMQGLEVEYFALQVISLCPAGLHRISAHADDDAITSVLFFRVLEACVCVCVCMCVCVCVCVCARARVCISYIRKCSHAHTHTHTRTYTDAAIIWCNPLQA